jgi:hypothetical protein
MGEHEGHIRSTVLGLSPGLSRGKGIIFFGASTPLAREICVRLAARRFAKGFQDAVASVVVRQEVVVGLLGLACAEQAMARGGRRAGEARVLLLGVKTRVELEARELISLRERVKVVECLL